MTDQVTYLRTKEYLENLDNFKASSSIIQHLFIVNIFLYMSQLFSDKHLMHFKWTTG